MFLSLPPKEEKKSKVLNIYEASAKFKTTWLSLLCIFLETVKFGKKEFLHQQQRTWGRQNTKKSAEYSGVWHYLEQVSLPPADL